MACHCDDCDDFDPRDYDPQYLPAEMEMDCE